MNPGLKGVVAAETAISFIDGQHGRLIYRGYDARELALKRTFEEVAHLLWYGKLPDKAERDKLEKALADGRNIPGYVFSAIDALPLEIDMMTVMRTAVSAMGLPEFGWKPTVDQAIRLTAALPVIIAYRHRKSSGLPFVEPDMKARHVENYLYMLNGAKPYDVHIQALETYMVLTIEHGMNASTFAARVAASTETDMPTAVTAALAAMKGPLHGGAPSDVILMLNEIGTKEKAERWLRDKLENGERLMGFGHRVYKTNDPRALALREKARDLGSDDPWLDLALHVEECAIRLLEHYKPGRKLYTNVEFYAAAVMRSINMEETLFTPTFSAARMPGWTAHVLEQASHNVIYRPESYYIGELPG